MPDHIITAISKLNYISGLLEGFAYGAPDGLADGLIIASEGLDDVIEMLQKGSQKED